MNNKKLEERCIWKDVSETTGNPEKYKMCFLCSGMDKTKVCYVSNKWFHNKIREDAKKGYKK